MSLLSMQTAIAKMCVDADFRRWLRRDPAEALRAFGLTVDEAEAVTTIDTAAIDRYAESLVGKRMSLVTKWFPLTVALLKQTTAPETLQRILNGYPQANIRDSAEVGGDWVRSEFEEFRNYLQDLMARDELAVPYLGDVLEFEATRQLMSQDPALSRSSLQEDSDRAARAAADAAGPSGRPLLGTHVRVLQFNCDIVAVIAQAEDGTAGSPVAAEPTWVLLAKKPGMAKVIALTLNPPLRDVLELCDGTRTTGEILVAMVSRHATPEGIQAADVREDCLAVVEQFCLAGLMTSVSTEVVADVGLAV